MRAWRGWCFGLVWLTWLGSCSVFPDRALLPSGGSGDGGAAGAASDAAGAASEIRAGSPGDAGKVGEIGAAGSSGVSGGAPGAGGEPGAAGGEGGAAGTSNCDAPEQVVILATEDTWIESAKPSATHAGDDALWVVAGDEERRAILLFGLPQLPEGATVLKGSVVLQLMSNADVDSEPRRLALFGLGQAVQMNRASWNNWGNGASRKWAVPGGDLSERIASLELPAGSQEGPLAFDVTAALLPEPLAAGLDWSVILLEEPPAPAAPAQLELGSSEARTGAPFLLVEYCPP